MRSRCGKPARMTEPGRNLRRARELFFDHDGSTFYMSRNDVDKEYLSYGVPKAVEEDWLAELTRRKLAALNKPGNWWTLNFLEDHRDPSHLAEVIAVPPIGELSQRVAYLEHLLLYIGICQSAGTARELVASALDYVEEEARKLLRAARSEYRRARVDKVLVDAKRRKRKLALYLLRHPEWQ